MKSSVSFDVKIHYRDGERALEVRVKRVRGSRLSMRLKDGVVLVNCPAWCSLEKVRDFIGQREVWVARQLEAYEARLLPEVVESFNFLGKPLFVSYELPANERGYGFEDGRFVVPEGSAREEVRGYISDFLMQQGKSRLPETLEEARGCFGSALPDVKVRVKKLSSIWGSCSRRTMSISLNSNLMQLEPELVWYVCLHELNHLRFSGHGRDFKEGLLRASPGCLGLDKELNKITKKTVFFL